MVNFVDARRCNVHTSTIINKLVRIQCKCFFFFSCTTFSIQNENAFDTNLISLKQQSVINIPEELDTMYFPFALNSAPSTNDVWPIKQAACNGWVWLENVEPVGIGIFSRSKINPTRWLRLTCVPKFSFKTLGFLL